MEAAKILVVDDHQTVARLMEAVLRLRGYRLFTAFDGKEGIEVARRERPDLIFLDVMMPGLDGYKVCSYLKENPLTREIPVVFLSARGESADAEIGRRVGAAEFMTKPFRTTDVLGVIDRLLTVAE